MKKFSITTTLLTLFSVNVTADSDNDHFPSLEAPDVKTAQCNLQNYNNKLQDILAKESLSQLDMVKIHELTYTLENAVARLNSTLSDVAEQLENVHKASESMDSTVIQNSGEQYLTSLNKMLQPASCAE